MQFRRDNDYRYKPAFKPVDTLSSSHPPNFSIFNSFTRGDIAMVNEREPPRYIGQPKATPNPLQAPSNEPEFGKASPLRNPLKSGSSNIFNIPKPGQRRPEHHRNGAPRQPSESTSTPQLPSRPRTNQPPSFSPINLISSSPDVVEIPKPSNFPLAAIQPAPRQTFSTANNNPPVNAFKSANLDPIASRDFRTASHESHPYQLNASSFDPTNFMDAAKANEDIKALLEGAFNADEDDRPRAKLRSHTRKQALATAGSSSLTDKLHKLQVSGAENNIENPKDEYDDDDGTVDGLKVKLLPHQIDGLAWMLDKEKGTRKDKLLPKGGILADDMGLGKTIQALALILSNPRIAMGDQQQNMGSNDAKSDAKTTLIVAPLALIRQWESEINSKIDPAFALKVLVHHGPSRTKRIQDLKRHDVVITTYQTLTSEHEASSQASAGANVGCFGVEWYRVILDEAHSIKNRNAKMTKAAYSLRSTYRWCLTGTPMQNNLDELQSLIRFLNIEPYNNLKTWQDLIIKPLKGGRGGLAIKRLQFFLKAFMKRRTKDVLKKDGALDFGRKKEGDGATETGGFKIVARKVETIVAHFDECERDFYQKLEARTDNNLKAIFEADKKDYIGALVLLLRLRQTCNHPELSRGNLDKEKETFPAGGRDTPYQPSSPSKSVKADDMDDVADLLGALTVKTRKCDSCGSDLSETERNRGAIRCIDCNGDFQRLRERSQSIEPVRTKVRDQHLARQKRLFHSRRIMDSDDGDDEDEEQKSGRSDEDEGNSINLDTDIEADSEVKEHPIQTLEGCTGPPSNQRPLFGSTKIRQLIKILKNESDEHKFIVFSEFTSMLDIIEPFLRQNGFRFTRYDGKMKNDDREASLERLRNDSRTRILLCSLRCGSLGLNLTAASRVVLLEPFWNPFVEEQAIDRVHRLNQTQDVTVYRLTIADSVEQRILDLQQKKRELANAAIEGGKAIAKLSMQDILRLFKRDAEVEELDGDERINAIGASASGSVLRGYSPQGKMLSTSPNKTPRNQKSPTRDGARQKPKFEIPASLQSEYKALYGHR